MVKASTFFSVLALVGVASASSDSSASSHSSHKQFIRRQSALSKQYPTQLQTPPASSLKKEWVDAYNKAKAAGKIPDIPQSTLHPDGTNTYPGKYQQDYCSWTVAKCNGPNDIYQAPDNEWAISFDDGPTGASSRLYSFLEQNNQKATHFMIGSQIVDYPDAVKDAASKGQELALHTWSHSLLTTKDDLSVVGELGWNLQIIYDLTGYIATKMRPPQGDIDARVRAIATEVFNVTCVMWDAESNDWCMEKDFKSGCPGEDPGKDRASVERAIHKALVGPKSPGVIILEHELRKETVQIFEEYYPSLKTEGWTAKAISDLGEGMPWYTNAQNGSEPPLKASSILPGDVEAAQASQTPQSSSNSSQGAGTGSSSPSKGTSSTTSGTSKQSANAQSDSSSGSTSGSAASFAVVATTLWSALGMSLLGAGVVFL